MADALEEPTQLPNRAARRNAAKKPKAEVTLRAYKFQIIAIVQVLDPDGNVTAEQTVLGTGDQPITAFGVEGLRKLADTFPKTLLALQNKEG
jgi:hypothetical protein